MSEARAGNLRDTRQKIAVFSEPQTRLSDLHPAWQAMIRFCQELGYGEIACVKIHDGIPISSEVVTRKIRWY
jgi:hypothetical protein